MFARLEITQRSVGVHFRPLPHLAWKLRTVTEQIKQCEEEGALVADLYLYTIAILFYFNKRKTYRNTGTLSQVHEQFFDFETKKNGQLK